MTGLDQKIEFLCKLPTAIMQVSAMESRLIVKGVKIYEFKS